MIANKLWQFPSPSTSMHSGYVNLIHSGEHALLLFDYYDSVKDDVFNSGILIDGVQALRTTCEFFIMAGAANGDYVWQAYDKLVEYQDSDWLEYYRSLNGKQEDFRGIKHYGIILDSVGFFEFLARSFRGLDTKKGGMDEFSYPDIRDIVRSRA